MSAQAFQRILQMEGKKLQFWLTRTVVTTNQQGTEVLQALLKLQMSAR